MTPARLVARSIRHHARASLALVTACAAATAVLIGSLAVGDSVRASLAALAANRVGRGRHVVQGRYVRHQLADDLRRELTVPVEAVVQLTGTASRADGSAATGGVQILGTDEAFAFLLPGEAALPSDGRSVVLNRELAERLGASVGDDLLLRLPRPAALSREAPFAPDVPPMAGLRLEVTAVLEPEHGGAFHLHAEQRIPPTAYVSRDTVQQRIGRLDQANLLVVGHRPTTEEVQAALDRSWRLADAGLHLQPTHDRQLQLASDGIFLDRIVEEAAARAGRHFEVLLDPTDLVKVVFRDPTFGVGFALDHLEVLFVALDCQHCAESKIVCVEKTWDHVHTLNKQGRTFLTSALHAEPHCVREDFRLSAEILERRDVQVGTERIVVQKRIFFRGNKTFGDFTNKTTTQPMGYL